MKPARKANARPPWRVFIVDDHPMMRAGLAQFLRQERDFRVCGEASEALEAMREIPRLHPHLVVLDISLPGKNGLELIKELRAQLPEIKVLVNSMHDEKVYAERALRAGASGYLMKQNGGEQLIEAARRVLEGKIYLSGTMTAALGSGARNTGKPQSPIARLTDRELEILELIGTGCANADVAARLHLSVKTIDAHRENMKRKLHLSNSTALNIFAVRWVEAGRFSEG